MALITNFEQLRTFVKFISSSDAASGMVSTLSAELRYVQPILTSALYNSLNTLVATDSAPSDKQDLLTLCRAVAAPMAVYHNLALMHVNITDSGLKTGETENFQSAHRWEYMEVREQLADQGSLAVESLITYLVEHAIALGWNNPEYSGSIFKTGKAFSEYFFLQQPHRSFFSLRPLIREAENIMNTSIGSTFYTALKGLQSPSENEKHVIDLVKKFVSNYAINKSLEKLSVAITASGFTVLLNANGDRPDSGSRNAPDNQLSLLYNSTKADAKMYLAKIKKYLDANASQQIFSDYFTSGFYTNPAVARVDRNEGRKGLFGF